MQVKWQPVPDGVFNEPVINYRALPSTAIQEQQKSQSQFNDVAFLICISSCTVYVAAF